MKIACLQFAPEVGKVQQNIIRADNILRDTKLPTDLDWLVLPEMAFSGKTLALVSSPGFIQESYKTELRQNS